jgi:predicted ATPase
LKLIVLTGGPGAGKSAVLAAARAQFCQHVACIPEAATILFTGGFPRHRSFAARAAAQRAIYHVQREAERLVDDELLAHSALCDRGTVDGEAYWPGDVNEFWHDVGSSHDVQLERYTLVVHMRSPNPTDGYNNDNPARIEDATTAHEIDERIMEAWSGHPNRIVIGPRADFETKLHEALDAIRPYLPVTI